MGWFWQPSSPSTKPEGATDGPVPPSAGPTPPAPTASTNAPPSSADDAADREMALFVAMLLKDTQSSSPSTSSLHAAAQQQQQQQQQQTQQRQATPQAEPKSDPDSSSWLSWARSRSRGDTPTPIPDQQQPNPPTTLTRTPQSLAMSEHVLPTTMSCRDAFDYAWHCHTPGAQWNAVYRYGSVRPCTELWDDFWFCMRTKSFSPEMRADAIRAHYRAKEEAKYGGGKPSSEDVWESREERVEPGTAFQVRFEAPRVDDAEFQRRDAERRRRIREHLDGEEGKK